MTEEGNRDEGLNCSINPGGREENKGICFGPSVVCVRLCLSRVQTPSCREHSSLRFSVRAVDRKGRLHPLNP